MPLATVPSERHGAVEPRVRRRRPHPREYGYAERNVDPPLSLAGVPDDAESLALVVDDPDAVEPAGKVWDHWVVWSVDPETTEIPED